MKITDLGLRLIKTFEGCKLKAYPDPGTGGDPWTIGWGATGQGIGKGVTWTQEQADKRLAEDIERFSNTVKNFCQVDLNENQFSALVSFAYNVGAWRGSTLFKLVRIRKFGDAAENFPLWCHSGKRVLQGLLDRRNCERLLFLGDTAGVEATLKARH